MPDNVRAGAEAVSVATPEAGSTRLARKRGRPPNCAAKRDCYSWRVVIRIRVAT